MRLPHPNATIGTVATIGGGELVAWLGHLAGWHVSAQAGIAISGAVCWLVLAAGRIGAKGVWAGLVNGFGGGEGPSSLPDTPPPSSTSATVTPPTDPAPAEEPPAS